MGNPQDHRKWAEDCVAMARSAEHNSDKVLWLTLAQSWLRLAEHVSRSANEDGGEKTQEEDGDEETPEVLEAGSSS
jgi:hypothetical protein